MCQRPSCGKWARATFSWPRTLCMWPVVNDGHRARASYVTPLRGPCQQAPRPPTAAVTALSSSLWQRRAARPGHQAPHRSLRPNCRATSDPAGSDPSGRRLASAHCHARRCSTLRPAPPPAAASTATASGPAAADTETGTASSRGRPSSCGARDEFLHEFFPGAEDKAAIAAGMEQLRAEQRA
jgi:hypothetical protein